MGRHLNVIIVPEEGGITRQKRVSVFWLKFLTVTVVILMVMIVFGAASWSSLVRRAMDYSRLQAENVRLDNDNRRIIRVAQEVENSRQILARIIRSLGGHLELGATDNGGENLEYNQLYSEGNISEEASELLGNGSFAVERIMAYSLPTQIPLDGFISQDFFEDYLFPARSHRGIDIAGKMGVPIKAAANGRVVFCGWTPYFGNCLMMAHPGGYLTFYGHNQINLKKVRDEATRGEPIALLGTSGRSSAPHLHFEIWKDGIPVDPMEFIQQEPSH